MFAKGADDISEIPAIRRFRDGLRLCANSAEGMYPEGPKVGGSVSWVGRRRCRESHPNQIAMEGVAAILEPAGKTCGGSVEKVGVRAQRVSGR